MPEFDLMAALRAAVREELAPAYARLDALAAQLAKPIQAHVDRLDSLAVARHLGLRSTTEKGLRNAARAWFTRKGREHLVEHVGGEWRVERSKLDAYLTEHNGKRERPSAKRGAGGKFAGGGK